MKSLFQRIKKFFGGNGALKVISVVLAIASWFIVTNINDPVVTFTFNNVPVTVINDTAVEQSGKVFQVIENTGEVVLKVRAKRSLRLKAADFQVTADMENLNFMDSVPLTVKCSNPYVSSDQIVIAPPSMKVKIENKVEQEFMVNVETTGSPATGYEVGSASLTEGKTVRIAGPATLVSKINKVLVNITVQQMTKDLKNVPCELKIIDKNGDVLTESQMNTLEIKNQMGIPYSNKTLGVDVLLWRVQNNVWLEAETVGEPAEGYHISSISTTPEEISLAGTEEALKALNGELVIPEAVDVSGRSESIETEISLADFLEGEKNLKQITGDSSDVVVKVQIVKNGNQMLTVNVADIEIIGKPEDMELIFTPADKIQVPIVAASEEKITSEMIHASIDLSSFKKKGTYTVPVSFELPEGVEVESKVTIAVNMEKKTTEG